MRFVRWTSFVACMPLILRLFVAHTLLSFHFIDDVLALLAHALQHVAPKMISDVVLFLALSLSIS